jgi:hypothetical protein
MRGSGEPSGAHGRDSKPILVLGTTGGDEGAVLLTLTECDKILVSRGGVGKEGPGCSLLLVTLLLPFINS